MSTGKRRLLAYIGMIMALSVSFKLVKDIVRLSQTDDRVIEAEEELERAKQEQIDLEEKLEEGQLEGWWEQEARNTLKMAKSNEVVVIVPEEVIKASRGGEKKAREEEAESNWQKWKELFYY